MGQKISDWRLGRAIAAALLGLLFLAAGLPSTGGILSEEFVQKNGLWSVGPFSFFPGPFFSLVGAVTISTACVLIGVARLRWLEVVGWVLLGFIFVCFLMA